MQSHNAIALESLSHLIRWTLSSMSELEGSQAPQHKPLRLKCAQLPAMASQRVIYKLLHEIESLPPHWAENGVTRCVCCPINRRSQRLMPLSSSQWINAMCPRLNENRWSPTVTKTILRFSTTQQTRPMLELPASDATSDASNAPSPDADIIIRKALSAMPPHEQLTSHGADADIQRPSPLHQRIWSTLSSTRHQGLSTRCGTGVWHHHTQHLMLWKQWWSPPWLRLWFLQPTLRKISVSSPWKHLNPKPLSTTQTPQPSQMCQHQQVFTTLCTCVSIFTIIFSKELATQLATPLDSSNDAKLDHSSGTRWPICKQVCPS
jgi:hypothetical protein